MRDQREILLAIVALAVLIVPNVWITVAQSRNKDQPKTAVKKQDPTKTKNAPTQPVAKDDEDAEQAKEANAADVTKPAIPSIKIVDMTPERPVVKQESTFHLASNDDKATIQVAIIKGEVQSEQFNDVENNGNVKTKSIHWQEVASGVLRLIPQKPEVLQLQFRSVNSEGVRSKPLTVAWQVKTTSQELETVPRNMAANGPIPKPRNSNTDSKLRKWGTKRERLSEFRKKETEPTSANELSTDDAKAPSKENDIQLLSTIDAHQGPITSFSKNFDDVFLSSGNDNKIKLWNVTDSPALEEKDAIGFSASALCFSRSQHLFLAGGKGDKSKATVFNSTTLDEVTNRVQVRSVHAADFSPSGKYFAVGGEGRVIDVCDSASGERCFVLTGVRKTVRQVLFLLDAPYLLVVSLGADEDQGEVLVWRFMSDGKSLEGTSPQLSSRELSSRIGRFRRSSKSSTRKNERRKRFEPEVRPTTRYQADSGKMMTCADSFVGLINRQTKLTVALGCDDKSIYLWEINRTDQPTDRIDGHETKVTALMSLADGNHLFAADAGGNVKLWSVSRKMVEHEFNSEAGTVNAIAFHGTSEKQTRLKSRGFLRSNFLGRSNRISSDMKGLLFTGHDDGKIRIWRVSLMAPR